MFDQISKTYDKVNTILSLGMDKRWRKFLVRNLPSITNCSLLDVATGTGEVLLEAFKQGKISVGVGVDLSQDMLKIAKEKFQRSPYSSQTNFIAADAMHLPFTDRSFDAVTISYGIRNVENVAKALKEMRRVLKPNGRLLVLEFSLPRNSLLKKMHLLYLRKLLPSIGSFFSKSRSSYDYLNQSIEKFPYGDTFLELLREAGFSSLEAHPILGGVTTLYIGDQ